ncbi:MAG: hypothetical protein AAGD00_03145 [Planctomycetota bacterium]
MGSEKAGWLAAGAVGVASIVMVSSAGDLNPPSGPVSPTGVSLSELSAQVSALGGAQGPWRIAYASDPYSDSPVGPGPDAVLVSEGPGVVHAISASAGAQLIIDGVAVTPKRNSVSRERGDGFNLVESPGGEIATQSTSDTGNQYTVLNVRYEHSFGVRYNNAFGGGELSVLWREGQ